VQYFCGRLHKISQQILVKHINWYFQRQNSVSFWILEFHKVSVATYCRWDRNLCVHIRREFSYESPGERILQIGPHLPKLLSNIKGYTFSGHSVVTRSAATWRITVRYYIHSCANWYRPIRIIIAFFVPVISIPPIWPKINRHGLWADADLLFILHIGL